MTDHAIEFRAPALPYPPEEYGSQAFGQFNNVLRLYFNQIDEALRELSEVAQPYQLQVARGNITGASAVEITGFNASVGTTFIVPWGLASQYAQPGSALTMTLASSASGDTSMDVLVEGLNASNAAISETVTTNASDGTTGVTTANAYLHVNKLTQTAGIATGNLSLTNGGTTYGYIAIGMGTSQMSQYTVPAGYSLYVDRVQAFSPTATGSQYNTLRERIIPLTGSTEYNVIQPAFTTDIDVPREYPRKILAQSSVEYEVKASSSTNVVSVIVEGVLVAD